MLKFLAYTTQVLRIAVAPASWRRSDYSSRFRRGRSGRAGSRPEASRDALVDEDVGDDRRRAALPRPGQGVRRRQVFEVPATDGGLQLRGQLLLPLAERLLRGHAASRDGPCSRAMRSATPSLGIPP